MEAKSSSGNRVLFAEQDVVLCVSARRALKHRGHKVALAHNDNDVRRMLDREAFDLVILDAALPRTNGLEVLRDIKSKRADTPVILIGDTASRFKQLAEGEGAFACLPLPADSFDELCDTVQRALGAPEPGVQAPTALDGTALLGQLRELIDASRAKPLADTLQVLLQASAAAMMAERSVVFLSQENTGLTLEGALGFSDLTSAARDLVENVGDAFAWRIATERQTLIEAPTERDESVAHRFIGVPLVVHGQLLGVLIDYALPAEPIDPARVVWLETFAAQGALAIYLARLEAENERLLRHDPLSGALKRQVFLDLADHEFRRSWRYKQSISLILVDVDGMNAINSRSGREFGDRVLREVANVCRNSLRSVDLLGRFENDALAILLVMTDLDGARSTAERLRAKIESIALSDARGPVKVTASLGVCAYPRENCASIFDLLAVALEAQRAARKGGASQIVYV